jgi:hypothetical protein
MKRATKIMEEKPKAIGDYDIDLLAETQLMYQSKSFSVVIYLLAILLFDSS